MSKKNVKERAIELFEAGTPGPVVARILNDEGYTTPRGLKFRAWTAYHLYRQATKNKKSVQTTTTPVRRDNTTLDRRIFHTLLNQADLPDSTKIRLLSAYLETT